MLIDLLRKTNTIVARSGERTRATAGNAATEIGLLFRENTAATNINYNIWITTVFF